MIDHIEILRDGAAAQYGSDAIAGVINIVLKTNAPGDFTTPSRRVQHQATGRGQLELRRLPPRREAVLYERGQGLQLRAERLLVP
jgi:outer membrane receptor for Fe3+-dicitrate